MKRLISWASIISAVLLFVLGGCSAGGGDSGAGTGSSGTITDNTAAVKAIADFAQAEEDAYANLALTFSDDGTKPIFDSTATLSKPAGRAAGTEITLLDQMSIQGVSNDPPVKTILTLSGSAHITKMLTYHWNYGSGDTPGTLSLKDTVSGTVYGPWTAQGNNTGSLTTATSSPPYLYWFVQPNADIPAGAYELVDSQPSTWAYTPDMGNKGLSIIYGWLTSSGTTDTGTGTSTGTVTSSGDLAAYQRMYTLNQKAADKFDLFDAAMTYLESNATAKPGMDAVDGKNSGNNTRGWNPISGFTNWCKGSGPRASQDILTTLGKLDAAGKQAAYLEAVSYFANRGDDGTHPTAGTDVADFENKLRSGALDNNAAFLNSSLASGDGNEAYKDAMKPIAKRVVEEGVAGIAEGVSALRSTLALLAPPIGQGMDKAEKFITAVNAPEAEIRRALTAFVAKKLGLTPEEIVNTPQFIQEIKNRAREYKKRNGAISESEALTQDGKIVVKPLPAGTKAVIVIDKSTKKVTAVAPGTSTEAAILTTPGTKKVLTVTSNTVILNDNVTATLGQTASVTIPSASTGTGTGTGTGAGGGSASIAWDERQFHHSFSVTAQLNEPPALSDGFVSYKSYTGKLSGSTLTVSGTSSISSTNPSGGPGSGDYYTLSVSVSVGSNTKTFEYTAPLNEVLSQSYSVSVPVSSSDTGGTFSVALIEVNDNYGNRGAVVSGTLTK